MSTRTTLIQPAELAALTTDRVLIVDCRFELADPSQGRRDYLAGHIPGAVFADLDTELSDLSRQGEGLGRHPLPHSAAFSTLLSRWGWAPGLQVVCYDAGSGALAAARLWWMLRVAGVRDVAVLDGGLAAWQAAGLPIEVGEPLLARAPSVVTASFDPHQILDHAGAAAAGAAGTLVDARAEPRYRGEVEPLDPVAGHVPGALNRPFPDNLDASGRFKSPAILRAEWLALLGAKSPADVVHMCGSGVTAAHNLLAMEYAGLAGSRLYPPSWSGWLSDPARPTAQR